ncbi:MAG: nitroreductase family deazaflavin-dependent oxidoreductase [Actinobacteria bacterium]|nr:nitroreductase family deazaflavin-dependent oxidoreductase [Actinomycetota bacterium]
MMDWAEKHVFNPAMRFGVQRGLAPRCYVLVETTGRRTGQLRHTPVAGTLDGDTYWLVAEHGADSAYVKNLTARTQVRVLVGRQWRSGTATCLPDDDPMTRRAWIDRRNGVVGRLDGLWFRGSSSAPLTVRIDLSA